jgi:hypothetical protein
MIAIVRAATTHDFLALVPRLVGFAPSESLVCVAFSGNRTCGAMRFDLPREAERSFHWRTATRLVGMLGRLDGVDAVVPVVYTARGFAGRRGTNGGTGMPEAAFVRAVTDAFRFSGFEVRDALCVAVDGWGSYFDAGCPAAGRPLELIRASTAHESIPAEARRPLGDIDEWASIPGADLSSRERVARALATLEASLPTPATDWERNGGDRAVAQRHPASGVCHAARGAAWAETLLGLPPDDVPDGIAASTIFLLASERLWETVAVQWAFGPAVGVPALEENAAASIAGSSYRPGYRLLLRGRGPLPDPERIERGIRLLKVLASRSPRANRSPVLSMLAWCNWALGRSTVARRFVDAALAAQPALPVAVDLRDLLDRGELPDWAFTRLDRPEHGYAGATEHGTTIPDDYGECAHYEEFPRSDGDN